FASLIFLSFTTIHRSLRLLVIFSADVSDLISLLKMLIMVNLKELSLKST
ncbi:hypothetical protein LINPERPRIM_LOCUS23856, partial [Linum perenne]